MQKLRRPLIAATLFVALGSLIASQASASSGSATGAISGQAESYALSAPVRDLPSSSGGSATAPSRVNPLGGEARGSAGRGQAAPESPAAPGRTPPFSLRFEGTSNPAACGGCSPPDTNGDVGPNHYIQMVNATKVAIYSKTGTLLRPIFDLGDLWTSGPCAGNAGDPIVVYDEISNRFVLSQFATPSHLCFAVSKGPNPLGQYHLYAFNVGSFPDYFKVGVWPNGYYVSANESTYTAYAFNRAKMLTGDVTANFVKFTGETNFLLPADVDGPLRPGGGGLFYTFKDSVFHGGGPDRIELFRLTPNYVTPASSTFTRIRTLPVAPFVYTVCGFFNFNCIPQQGTAQTVDAVSEWPMWRFAYRRIGSSQRLVGNFTVGGGDGDAGAQIRWFELRANLGAAFNLFQEGTHDPGTTLDRFMGSIAMDENGNIALGYSASASTAFPSIRYATRNPTDPPGTLEPERVLQLGNGSQTGSNRWGDYSEMAVDPTTDCQFWYTNQYYNPSSATNWKTKIGAFTVPGCT